MTRKVLKIGSSLIFINKGQILCNSGLFHAVMSQWKLLNELQFPQVQLVQFRPLTIKIATGPDLS